MATGLHLPLKLCYAHGSLSTLPPLGILIRQYCVSNRFCNSETHYKILKTGIYSG
jgi:hypothetical protein